MRDASGRLALVVLCAFAAGWVAPSAPVGAIGVSEREVSRSPVVHVQGNHLVDRNGKVVQLRGLNRSGSEYACVEGWGIFDGPVGNRSIAAMKTWRPTIVRVPLNEDCWLGINGVDPSYGGAAYRQAIKDLVARLEARGLLVDLELHWNAPGHRLAKGQQVMADHDHSPDFWRGVAKTFSSDRAVLFELYNEPHDLSWQCWLHGCRIDAGWRTAGMQGLVNAVRSTGARNVIMVGGLGWSSDLSGWLAHKPNDPTGQLVATFHTYDFSGCNDRDCWNSTVAQVARHVPVVMTEFGETDCAGGYVRPLMHWADTHGVSYLAWTWDVWNCRSGPALIKSYDGTPTGFGRAVRDHYLGR